MFIRHILNIHNTVHNIIKASIPGKHRNIKLCKTSIQLNSNTFNNATHQIVMSSVWKFEQFPYNFAPCNILYIYIVDISAIIVP